MLRFGKYILPMVLTKPESDSPQMTVLVLVCGKTEPNAVIDMYLLHINR